jgi:hypothetical protein
METRCRTHHRPSHDAEPDYREYFGAIPIVGDFAHIAWKANRRNYNLLIRDQQTSRRHTWQDWLFVIGAYCFWVQSCFWFISSDRIACGDRASGIKAVAQLSA